MGIDNRIPFGLDPDSGLLVDVGSVRRGRACGCVCPSCGACLVAKQGIEKEWHFSHTTQDSEVDATRACDHSFAVSVRRMIHQVVFSGMRFRIPDREWEVSGVGGSWAEGACRDATAASPARTVKMDDVNVDAAFCGVKVDVLAHVQGVPLVLYVTYEGRRVPDLLKEPTVKKCGVVELKVDCVAKVFAEKPGGKYREILLEYLETGLAGKSWAYHFSRPRSAGMQPRPGDSLADRRNAGRAGLGNSAFDRAVASVVADGVQMADRQFKRYVCRLCESTWQGESRDCPVCRTHLYCSEFK